ncbi:MAG: hypothetical protein FJZ59_03870 [Chlamydiae bacterium]|nr:hypothetical protein [Chlamydiota bacterium]
MDNVLKTISNMSAEISVQIAEEEAKTSVKKRMEQAKAGLRRASSVVLEHIATATEPLKHSQHVALQRIATKIEDLKTENEDELSKTEANAAKQTLKGKLLKHARKVSTGVAVASTAARAFLTPEAAEIAEIIPPSVRTFEAAVGATRYLKNAGDVLSDVSATATSISSSASSALDRLTRISLDSSLTPLLFSPSSQASSQSYRSDGDTSAPPMSMADFLSPRPFASPVGEEGMGSAYLKSNATDETKKEVLSTLKEELASKVDGLLGGLKERFLDGETEEALKTLTEHHISKAVDEASSALTTAAHKISAFARKSIKQ